MKKTGDFTRHLWNHYKEYWYLCIILDKLLELKKYEKYLYDVCDSIYEPNDEYELWGIEIRPGGMPVGEEVSQDIYFEDIQKQILEEIESAKYTIWIAMAWFTNPVIYSALLKKRTAGLCIEIILDDNDKNHRAPVATEGKFPIYWVAINSLYANLMHDKFCIIDFKTVLHGTFNWTKAANYNKETMSIDNNRATAETFADEYIKLKLGSRNFR